jgi:hypothetical protein
MTHDSGRLRRTFADGPMQASMARDISAPPSIPDKERFRWFKSTYPHRVTKRPQSSREDRGRFRFPSRARRFLAKGDGNEGQILARA